MHALSQKAVTPVPASWLGPLFGWEIIREARKGRSYLPRILYTGGLLLLLYFIVGSGTITLSQASRLGEYLFYSYLTFQYLAVFVLTPLYVAGSLIEERQQGTLVLLLTTDVTPRELILGKMMGRLVPMLGSCNSSAESALPGWQ
jgi:ABC-2 type transport system permease protein